MQPHEFGIVREQVVLDAHGVILEEGAGAWQPPELLASINRLNLLLAQKRLILFPVATELVLLA
ncbi:unnamed protein product [Symbiodinium necroappetens]|nr:unnamed protein product [Symbiodinium necroappetens]